MVCECMAAGKVNTTADAIFGSVLFDHHGAGSFLNIGGEDRKGRVDGLEDLWESGDVHADRRIAENRRDFDTFVDIARA